ncbi:MAG: DUF2231 domain-containing protein [Chloroflexi bacterium]|nr:DUF2231 domain-containing protein [Chloroflexota bacterium]HEV8054026.1 DUF2231 domain-containing protein [Candidatus Limnocylindrales bacterium]
MESRFKALGHPIHPILVPYAIGLLHVAVLFDLVGIVMGGGSWHELAFWMIVAGIVAGAAATVFGWADWSNLPEGTRAKAIGRMHGMGNGLVLLLYSASWLLRTPDPTHPGALPLILSFAGAALLGATGWLGGELVDRLRVGVDDGAHLDAPSSLSGRPADER